MPGAYLYRRVSHRSSCEGNSLEDQERRLRDYADTIIDPTPEFIVLETDAKVSAYSRAFMTRPGVLRIVNNIKRGDHFVVDRFDRSFRSTADFLLTSQWMDKRGISLHIVDFRGKQFDMSKPVDRHFMTTMAANAELESGMKSVRCSAALYEKRDRGEACGNKPPLGMKFQKHYANGKWRKFVVWCAKSRGLMNDIHVLRDQCGFGLDALTTMLNADYCNANGLDYSVERFNKQRKFPWKKTKVQRWYIRARFYYQLQLEGIVNVPEVTHRIQEVGKKPYSLKAHGIQKYSQLEPVANYMDVMPEWAKRVIPDDVKPFDRARCFRAAGAMQAYASQTVETHKADSELRVQEIGECPICKSVGHAFTQQGDEGNVDHRDEVFCSSCNLPGFVHVEDDGGVAEVRWLNG